VSTLDNLERERARLRRIFGAGAVHGDVHARPPSQEWQHYREGDDGRLQHVGPCREFDHEPGMEPWSDWWQCPCVGQHEDEGDA
jgi:hypothetical protein